MPTRANNKDHDIFLSFCEQIGEVSNINDKWRILNEHIAKLGFSGATYGLSSTMRSDGIAQEVVYRSSYPDEFFELYIKESLADHDFAVRHCANAKNAALWNEVDDAYPTERSDLLKEIANDYGLKDGIIIPFHCKNDSRISGIGLSFAESLKSNEHLHEHWPLIRDMCIAFDENMRSPSALRQVYRLSPREIDCLTLTCVGKLNKEISYKLKLSEKTVEHYLASAIRKLRCRNKHHAAAKAAMLGVIAP